MLPRRLRVLGCDAAVRGIGVAATVAESARHLGGGERVPTLRVARRQVGARVGASVPPLRGCVASCERLDSSLRKMVKGEEVNEENSGMSKGEWREFQDVLADR